MDNKRIARMAEKIAQEDQSNDSLSVVDQAVDRIIASIMEIDENLSAIKPENDKQRKAITDVKDLMDTAIAPYMADIVKALNEFEEE